MDIITISMVFGHLAMPPAEFDHEPTVPYRVEMVEPERITGICGYQFGKQVLGCYVWWCNSTIYLRSDMDAGATALALRHEKGHVNGWSHSGEHGNF